MATFINIEDDKIPFPSQIEFRDEAHEELFMAIATLKKMISPCTTDFDTIAAVGIEMELHHLLQNSGSSALAAKVETIPILVYEFISSFSCMRETDNNRIYGWKFRLGNKELYYGVDDLYVVFGFPKRGVIPRFKESQIAYFWKKISGMDAFESDMSPQCIRLGVWKYLHRLIALNVNTRCGQGSAVTTKDIEIMHAIDRKNQIDYIHILGTRFEEWQDMASVNKALGGAIFITRIAEHENYHIEGRMTIYKPLDIYSKIACKMLESNRTDWVYNPTPGRRSVSMANKRARGEGSSRSKKKELVLQIGSAWDAIEDRLQRIELKQDQLMESSKNQQAMLEELLRRGT